MESNWREVILWEGQYLADAQERRAGLSEQSGIGRLRYPDLRGYPGNWRLVVSLPLETSETSP